MALLLLFSAWACWLLFGRVSIYVSSQSAHFEAEHFSQPIQSAVEGVITSCNISLSQRVREGEVLVALDATSFELDLAEARANRKANEMSIVALENEIEAEQRAREAQTRLVSDSRRAGIAKVAVSETSEKFQEREAEVLRKLNEKELASKLDQLRSEGASATIQAQVAATSAEARQTTSAHVATLFDRDVQIAALTKLLTESRSKVEVLDAQIAKISHEIDRRSVRAATAGTLADIAPCTSGMAIARDQKLATLVPESRIRIAAFFKPEDAVGRVKAGQAAILRVDNFPWTQYGTVNAHVVRVGSEPRDGTVRVELDVTAPNPAIPITYGLTAVSDIQVERVTPLQLLLRTLGKHLTTESSAPRAAASAGVSER